MCTKNMNKYICYSLVYNIKKCKIKLTYKTNFWNNLWQTVFTCSTMSTVFIWWRKWARWDNHVFLTSFSIVLICYQKIRYIFITFIRTLKGENKLPVLSPNLMQWKCPILLVIFNSVIISMFFHLGERKEQKNSKGVFSY